MTVARVRSVIGVMTLVAMLGAAGTTSSSAATIRVRCPQDDLQAAIFAASPGDTLWISGRCIGTFTIAKRLTLRGGSGATLDGGGIGTTLTVTAQRQVVIRGLRITGGDTQGDGGGIRNIGRLVIRNSVIEGNGGDTEGALGGGVYTTGSLVLRDSSVRGNGLGGLFGAGGGIANAGRLTIWRSTIADNGAYGGGNISNSGTAAVSGSLVTGGSAEGAAGIENTGTLTITSSTISRNSSSFIGGIYNNGTATLTNSTVSGNSGAAGGLTNGGGSMTLTSTTVSGNRGTDPSGPGGINSISGTVLLRSSIVAANENDSAPDCAGKIASKGYNLIGDADGCTITAAVGDLIGRGSGSGAIDPRLGALVNNGGRTPTMALLHGSPALNAIPVGSTGTGGFRLCLATGTTDQRSVPRPQGGACDIGAFERRAA
jgi:hypothetical protein